MLGVEIGKANVIIDGGWGSSGKGLLAGFLYDKYKQLSAGVCDFMPNAGHTVYLPNGRRFVSRHVPIAAAYGRRAFIGPHAAVHFETLRGEMAALAEATGCEFGDVYIHPLAAMIQPADVESEKAVLGHIASTQKGGHAAIARKMMRPKGIELAESWVRSFKSIGIKVADTHKLVQQELSRDGAVLVETAQGFDLGLNHGTTYPYVTGRDCLVGRAIDNAGVSIRDVGSIIGCMRTFPIRVGSTVEGSSGPCYDDQKELSWSEVSKYAGVAVEERTTVTNRVRRVFTFSFAQLRRFLTFVRPDYLFLNFWNYTDAWASPLRQDFLASIRENCALHGCKLMLLGRGPMTRDVQEADGTEADLLW